MTAYEQAQAQLQAEPKTWLITGAAGFVGSHLLQKLLSLGQGVVGLDSLATGFLHNLEDVRRSVGEAAWSRFRFLRGDVSDLAACRDACAGCDFVLHQAGFISVPLSLEQPLSCHATNVTGTLNLLVAARDAGIRRFVFASSSAVYGDSPRMPQIESEIGRPLSPYAASKYMDELYAGLFSDHSSLTSAGLRYFNVFGPRQNPKGGYAAVIPQWISAMLRGEACHVNGDGNQTRDFCHVANVVQANLLAATAEFQGAKVYNVALGAQTSLLELHQLILSSVRLARPAAPEFPPRHGPPRAGDIIHSGADITKIRAELGFAPVMSVRDGLEETVRWYANAA